MQELLHNGCSTASVPTFPLSLPGGMRLEASEKRSSREGTAAWPEQVASPQTVVGLAVFSIPVQMVLSVSLGLKTSWKNEWCLWVLFFGLVWCLVSAELNVQLGSAALIAKQEAEGARTM